MMTLISELAPFESLNDNDKHGADNKSGSLEKSKCTYPDREVPLRESEDGEEEALPGVCTVSRGLLLGGAFAGSATALRRLRPACAALVCAAAELPTPPAQTTPPCYLRLPLLDLPDIDIYQHFDLVADLIHQVQEGGGRTLVHCVAGVSRSATLCLAYLMKYEGMNLRDAYLYLRSKRSQIRPNTGFFKQLIKYEQELFGQTSVKMVYCEVIDRGIPDVYEPDYQAMAWYTKRYGEIRR